MGASLSMAGSVMGIASGVNSLMGGGSSSGQGATNQANPLAPYQQGWAQQLNQLMANPSGVTNTPGYQFGMQQGQQQLQRGMAKTGQTQSGAEQIALQQYGQEYAGQQYQQQISNLANVATGNSVAGQIAGSKATQGGWDALNQGMGGLKNIYGGGSNQGQTAGYQAMGGDAVQNAYSGDYMSYSSVGGM